MRKILSEQENPIDDILITLSEKTFPFFKSLGFTANDITTLSLIFGIISIYALYKDQLVLFALTYLLSYFFDIADGGYARKYNITSTFGCYYDHIKDLLVNVLVIAVLLKKHWENKRNVIIFVLYITIFGFMMTLNLGCQENIYDENEKNNESPCLSIFRKMCKNDPKNTIKFTRFFGCGTYVFLFIILVVYLNK